MNDDNLIIIYFYVRRMSRIGPFERHLPIHIVSFLLGVVVPDKIEVGGNRFHPFGSVDISLARCEGRGGGLEGHFYRLFFHVKVILDRHGVP